MYGWSVHFATGNAFHRLASRKRIQSSLVCIRAKGNIALNTQDYFCSFHLFCSIFTARVQIVWEMFCADETNWLMTVEKKGESAAPYAVTLVVCMASLSLFSFKLRLWTKMQNHLRRYPDFFNTKHWTVCLSMRSDPSRQHITFFNDNCYRHLVPWDLREWKVCALTESVLDSD